MKKKIKSTLKYLRKKKEKRTWDTTQELENPRLRTAILEIVENQIRDNEPPETKETFQRLVEEGYAEEEAKKLLGCVVSTEVFGVLQEGREFDREQYVNALHRLPVLP